MATIWTTMASTPAKVPASTTSSTLCCRRVPNCAAPQNSCVFANDSVRPGPCFCLLSTCVPTRPTRRMRARRWLSHVSLEQSCGPAALDRVPPPPKRNSVQNCAGAPHKHGARPIPRGPVPLFAQFACCVPRVLGRRELAVARGELPAPRPVAHNVSHSSTRHRWRGSGTMPARSTLGARCYLWSLRDAATGHRWCGFARWQR